MNDRPAVSWWARADRVGRAIETTMIVAILGGLVLFASAQIVLRNAFSIGIEWSDGHKAAYPVRYLRQHCPCAPKTDDQ